MNFGQHSTRRRPNPLNLDLYNCVNSTGRKLWPNWFRDAKLPTENHNISIKDHEAALVEACQKDIGKATFETYLTEIDWCTNDIVFVCKHLKKWAKGEKAPDIPLSHAALKPSIRKDPLGCVLIIGLVSNLRSCSLSTDEPLAYF